MHANQQHIGKSMTIIKNEVNIWIDYLLYNPKFKSISQYALIVYYMIREGVQMEYVRSLLLTILAKQNKIRSLENLLL